MAETDNFSEINENFDTIKALLNSIRAQGILNTTDVDKLLSGINNKLEKINTEEDIDLIKAFLSELKQNLDERHNVLISKFGAIESLFSNLLKNSADSLKSSEVKELFDIVATNLSVFSREVVSQKETLTDITLRIDAMRSDDTKKNDIIKNITVLKNDLDRLSNGFDSIVLSLNENFKTLIKTISGIDQSESIDKFSEQIKDVVNSSNTILSALQLMDKKNTQIEDAITTLSTKDDINTAKRSIAELSAQGKLLTDAIDSISQRSYKIDNLSEKIDASVNIIAGLKSIISEAEDASLKSTLNRLSELETTIREVTSDKDFLEFKSSLETVLRGLIEGSSNISGLINSVLEKINSMNGGIQAITSGSSVLNDAVSNVSEKITSVIEGVKSLDINVNLQKLSSEIEKINNDVREQIVNETGKVSQLLEVSVTRTLNDLTSNAEALDTRLKDTHTAIAELCEKSFTEVLDSVAGLKTVVSQIDENNVSANNAIFSNIADRLAVFEDNLKSSLDNQEEFISASSGKMVEQVSEITKLAGNLDYKLDASLIEVNNSKRGFEELKTAVDGVLALDFVNVVKDLRVDLYAVKQDLVNALDNSSSDMSEKYSNDLFGKYELLISRLDSVEDEIKNAQRVSLDDMKTVLDKISSSIVDVLSYVSVQKDIGSEKLEAKLEDISHFVNDSTLNYIENVRDIVDIVRVQVDNNLKQVQNEMSQRISSINSTIDRNHEALRNDIQNSYDKLIEVQGNFDDIKTTLTVNNSILTTNVNDILSSAESLKGDFEAKMTALKTQLLEKVSDFKQEFTCDNADKISELKFNSETLHSKAVQTSVDLKNELRDEISGIIDNLKRSVSNLSEQLEGTLLKVEGSNKEVVDYVKNDFCAQINSSVDSLRDNVAETMNNVNLNVSDVVNGFNSLQTSVNRLNSDTTSSLTSTLSKILENFVSLKSVMNNIGEQSSEEMKQNVQDIRDDFALLKKSLEACDRQLDEDLSRQIKIMESNFDSLNSLVTDLITENEKGLHNVIESNLSSISEKMSSTLAEKLEGYKVHIENVFDRLNEVNNNQSEFLQARARELNEILNSTLEKQNGDFSSRVTEIATELRKILDKNIELTSADYNSLKEKLNNFTIELDNHNTNLVQEIKAQMDEITKFVNSGLEVQAQEVNSTFEQINSGMQQVSSLVRNLNEEIDSKINIIKEEITAYQAETKNSVNGQANIIFEKLNNIVDEFSNNTSKTIEQQLAETRSLIENVSEGQRNQRTEKSQQIIDEIQKLYGASLHEFGQIRETAVSENTKLENELKEINSHIDNILEYKSGQINEKNKEILAEIQKLYDIFLKEFEQTNLNNVNDSVELNNKLNRINSLISEISENEKNQRNEKALEILAGIEKLHTIAEEKSNKIKDYINENIIPEVNDIPEKIQKMFEENSLNIVTQVTNNNSETINKINKESIELKAAFETLNARLDKDEISQMNLYKAQIEELNTSFNELIEEAKSVTRTEVAAITETLLANNKSVVEELDSILDEKVDKILTSNTDISTAQLQTTEAFASKILENVAGVKQNSIVCKDLIEKLIKSEINEITNNIEKETDIIVGDIIEQFSLLKDSQKDELSSAISEIEGSINGYIIDSVNDLKSYFDVKSDSSVMNSKLDNLKTEMERYADETTENINKLLEVSVFSNTISDLKSTNEVLITSMADKLNEQITDFVKNNVSKKLEDKLNLFDKKFIDAVVDKYEEIKLVSSEYNKSFEKISLSIQDLSSSFLYLKDEISKNIADIVVGIHHSIGDLALQFGGLTSQFENLKAQILNKSFDEAFQASLNKQVEEIENLVAQQMEYMEDINELCVTNLPDISEMSAIVKYSIQESLKEIVNRVDSNELSFEQGLDKLKSDIITQFLNIFNQISFITEQEEILDFIQEKHSELITILSHIVTTVDGVETVKDNVAVVDSKIDNLKEDINLINEKITAIMSSDGNVDYIYSLQDLESDIANLRVVLNEMKSEMPKFEAEQFQKEFDNLAEDIVSISTRTNKLLLASDESTKTLQENLHDFKLVINDLDERTRNFAHEAGLDIIDRKLGSINNMMQNGAKTNQVFNQIFEYLAEWVDKAGTQISTISDKVETLDEIGQIRVMLEDLKAQASDNSEADELIEALGNIFEKQAKKISSLEAKLDRIIVETNINNKNNKIDLSPMESTLNKFLVAMDDKLSSQQSKINLLESKLEEVMSVIDNNDTTQLTKKVGGMDRQIAKLNKSIEKIASHVVEK